jgi:hypothetical protein
VVYVKKRCISNIKAIGQLVAPYARRASIQM